MTFETLADGRKAMRIEVRAFEDGFTRAAMQVPGGQWLVLCTVASPAYEASTDVQRSFFELARAVVTQALAEAGLSVTDATAVPAGAPLDMPKH